MPRRLRGVLPAVPLVWAFACSDASAPVDAVDMDAGDAGDVTSIDGEAPPDAGTEAGLSCAGDSGAPEHLFCTGLYSDWATKTIAPGVMAYEPGYRLWSDGTEKSRWIRLPPGTKIDTSNMDEWTFPLGTALWKEFSLAGRRIETRLIEKRGDRNWRRTTFRWNADETAALELQTGEIGIDGGSYEIPAVAHCNVCHAGRVDGVLGFEAVSLSSPEATGLTMAELVKRDLVTAPPTAALVAPGSPEVSAALGYLHANCGTTCHSRSPYANANWTGLWMNLTHAQLATPEDTDTYKTAVEKGSSFQMPTDGGVLLRVKAKEPERSAVYVRASTRDDALKIQMPPLITHEIDPEGLETLRTWINGL